MNELDAIKARREAISHMVRDTTTRRATAYDAQATAAFIAAAPADVDTLLAMVERLTARAEEAEALLAGSPADTLAWALDKREQELREARCEVERLTGENANAKAALVAAAALLHQSNAEVERLTGELAAAQQEAAQVRRAGATKLMQADAEIDALRAELAAERSIMNMVPEYIQYLSKWRAGDGTFLLFNEWVAQRIAQPQA